MLMKLMLVIQPKKVGTNPALKKPNITVSGSSLFEMTKPSTAAVSDTHALDLQGSCHTAR